MSTAYSTTSFRKDINTLEELDRSGLSISTKNTDIFGGTNGSHVGSSLTKKIISSKSNSTNITATERKTSVVERRTDAGQMIQLNFTGKDGQPKLHVVNECPRSYHLAYIVYKDFPLLFHLNRYFQRTVEAGLNDKWYYDTEFAMLLKNRQLEEAGETTKKLTILDVQTSFWFLVISLVMSVLVFFVEIFVFYGGKLCQRFSKKKKVKRKNNDYNQKQYPFLF